MTAMTIVAIIVIEAPLISVHNDSMMLVCDMITVNRIKLANDTLGIVSFILLASKR